MRLLVAVLAALLTVLAALLGLRRCEAIDQAGAGDQAVRGAEGACVWHAHGTGVVPGVVTAAAARGSAPRRRCGAA